MSESASGVAAGSVGGSALGLELGVVFTAVVWGIDEPFGSFASYLTAGIRGLMFIPAAALIGLLLGAFLGRVLAGGRSLTASVVRAAFLAPVPLLIPSVLWGIAAVIGAARWNVQGSVPPWTIPFQFVANPLPVFAAAALIFWLWCWTASRLSRTGGRICVGCGYSLQGLQLGSVCPECGRPTARHLTLHS